MSDKTPSNSIPKVIRGTVIDDPNDCGRTVDAFEQWFADIQLEAFTKRYPLTGRHKDDIEPNSVNGNSRRIPPLRSSTGNSRPQSTTTNVNGRVMYYDHKFEKLCRRGGLKGNADVVYGGTVQSYLDSLPTALQRASTIQQRLELLLYTQKEKKAHEKMKIKVDA